MTDRSTMTPIDGTLRFPALAAEARTAEPITLALPLPQALLRDPAAFRLLDGDASLPVQARATSHWPDRSIRWLFVRAQVDLPGRAAKEIRWAPAPPATTPEHERIAPALTVRESAEGWLVDTGRLHALVPRDGTALLRDITLDGTAVPGEVGPFRLAADQPAGAAPAAATAGDHRATAPPVVTVEEEGPVAVVLRLDGWHEPGVWRQRVRLTFHAGKAYVTVAHRFTLEDTAGPRLLRALHLDWVPASGAGTAPRLALGQGHYRTAIASGSEPVAAVLGPEALFGQEHAPELFFGDFWAAIPARTVASPSPSTRRSSTTPSASMPLRSACAPPWCPRAATARRSSPAWPRRTSCWSISTALASRWRP